MRHTCDVYLSLQNFEILQVLFFNYNKHDYW